MECAVLQCTIKLPKKQPTSLPSAFPGKAKLVQAFNCRQNLNKQGVCLQAGAFFFGDQIAFSSDYAHMLLFHLSLTTECVKLFNEFSHNREICPNLISRIPNLCPTKQQTWKKVMPKKLHSSQWMCLCMSPPLVSCQDFLNGAIIFITGVIIRNYFSSQVNTVLIIACIQNFKFSLKSYFHRNSQSRSKTSQQQNFIK